MAPIENLRVEIERPATSAEVIAGSLNEDISNLEATRRALLPELYNLAVEMVLNAERIYIVGYGASAFLAGLMAHGLDPFCKTIQCTIGSGGPSHVARQLFKYTERDLVIGISFPRYAEDAVTVLAQVREKTCQYLPSPMSQARR